jgi:hypothetical protein
MKEVSKLIWKPIFRHMGAAPKVIAPSPRVKHLKEIEFTRIPELYTKVKQITKA